MRPPEAAVPWTGYIVNCVCIGVMISMVRDPSARRAGAIKDGKENEELLHDGIQADGPVSQRAMIANSGADSSARRQEDRCEQDLPRRQRKQEYSYRAEDMNRN
jgi:hypothetical protein